MDCWLSIDTKSCGKSNFDFFLYLFFFLLQLEILKICLRVRGGCYISWPLSETEDSE